MMTIRRLRRQRQPRRQRPNVWLLGAIAALMGLGLSGTIDAPASAADTDTGWHQLDVDGLALYGNCASDELGQIAEDVQKFRSLLERTSSGMDAYSPLPTHIYVFRNGDTFDPFSRGADGEVREIVGYFQRAKDGNYSAINADYPEQTRATVYHEYFHYFAANNLSRLPRWLNEGLAEYYSTFVSKGRDAELGHSIDHHTTWLTYEKWIPLADLFEVDPSSSTYHGDLSHSFYAQSWALTHWIMVGDLTTLSRMNQLPRIGKVIEVPALSCKKHQYPPSLETPIPTRKPGPDTS